MADADYENNCKRNRRPICKIVAHRGCDVKCSHTPHPEFTGVRIRGMDATVRRNFFRTAADYDDGRIPGFIVFRKKRYDGVCIRTNGYLVFHPTEAI